MTTDAVSRTQAPGDDLRIREGVVRGASFTFRFDGRDIVAHEGESVAAALWAAGVRTWPHAVPPMPPARTLFCATGACRQCALWIDGVRTEACRAPAAAGLDVRSQP